MNHDVPSPGLWLPMHQASIMISTVHCRCSQKAIESAIQARQWSKAVQIIDLQDPSIGSDYYKQIAEHYHLVKDHQLAEQYYSKAGMAQEAVDMYIKADLWEEAYQLAVGCMAQEDLQQLYTGRAKQLEEEGKLKEAERIYLIIEEPDLAISMYKRVKRYDPMVKLVAAYHPDLLTETHLHLAKVRDVLCSRVVKR